VNTFAPRRLTRVHTLLYEVPLAFRDSAEASHRIQNQKRQVNRGGIDPTVANSPREVTCVEGGEVRKPTAFVVWKRSANRRQLSVSRRPAQMPLHVWVLG
jgi:hypothetical protein